MAIYSVERRVKLNIVEPSLEQNLRTNCVLDVLLISSGVWLWWEATDRQFRSLLHLRLLRTQYSIGVGEGEVTPGPSPRGPGVEGGRGVVSRGRGGGVERGRR